VSRKPIDDILYFLALARISIIDELPPAPRLPEFNPKDFCSPVVNSTPAPPIKPHKPKRKKRR